MGAVGVVVVDDVGGVEVVIVVVGVGVVVAIGGVDVGVVVVVGVVGGATASGCSWGGRKGRTTARGVPPGIRGTGWLASVGPVGSPGVKVGGGTAARPAKVAMRAAKAALAARSAGSGPPGLGGLGWPAVLDAACVGLGTSGIRARDIGQRLPIPARTRRT
jgi:hypothetical protein